MHLANYKGLRPMAQSEYLNSCQSAAAAADMFSAIQTGAATLTKYANAFYIPFLISMNYFNREESQRIWTRTPMENLLAYIKLGQMNLDLTARALSGSFEASGQFIQTELQNVLPSLAAGDPGVCSQFAQRMDKLVKGVAYIYPEAIDGIESEFGFHFERQPAHGKVDETGRFELYQVMPSDTKVKVRENGKPLLIIPPFVLGANILSFLPGEERSYAHAFANQGIPTYIRVLKDIQASEDVQVMTPEDDALDTHRFCEILNKRHLAPVTLNGYCQGGYSALCNLLSGKLDGLVDAFITCVAPMDGTRSEGLSQFLKDLPNIFNDLSYGTKVLPNGNRVADGTLMGWIYKLKSIEMETPLLAMWRDMMLVAHTNGNPEAISKTASALNHWLMYERNDLPMEITRMSFESYNTPITADGTLPVKLFGRKLNLKHMEAKQIKWLICYGLQDDLVEPQTALAPLDYIDAQVTAFPKGHVAIATSWSYPESAYALHQRYEKDSGVGPVRFQLDLEAELSPGKKTASSSSTAAKKGQIKVTQAKTKTAPKAKSKVKAKAVAKAKATSKTKASSRKKGDAKTNNNA
jgi:hypothetical protein